MTRTIALGKSFFITASSDGKCGAFYVPITAPPKPVDRKRPTGLPTGPHHFQGLKLVEFAKPWDLESGKELGVIPSATQGQMFSPDGKTLAFVDHESGLFLWDVAAGKKITLENKVAVGTVGGKTLALGLGMTFSPDGKFFALGVLDREVWSTSTGKRTPWTTPTFQPNAVEHPPMFGAGSRSLVEFIELYNDPKDGPLALSIWDVTTGKERKIIKTTRSILCVSPNLKLAASHSRDRKLELLDMPPLPRGK